MDGQAPDIHFSEQEQNREWEEGPRFPTQRRSTMGQNRNAAGEAKLVRLGLGLGPRPMVARVAVRGCGSANALLCPPPSRGAAAGPHQQTGWHHPHIYSLLIIITPLLGVVDSTATAIPLILAAACG